MKFCIKDSENSHMKTSINFGVNKYTHLWDDQKQVLFTPAHVELNKQTQANYKKELETTYEHHLKNERIQKNYIDNLNQNILNQGAQAKFLEELEKINSEVEKPIKDGNLNVQSAEDQIQSSTM